MSKRFFIFAAALFFAAEFFAADFSEGGAAPVCSMTRDQIERSSISSMEELLEKMGLETIYFSPTMSAYGNTATSRNTVFIIDGVRQASFDAGEFDISLFDVSLIEKIEVFRGVFSDEAVFTGGNAVKITTCGDSVKKFNFASGINSYANMISGFNANLQMRAGLQESTIGVSVFGNFDSNNFKYREGEFSDEYSYLNSKKSKLSGERFYNVGSEFFLSSLFDKGEVVVSDRFSMRNRNRNSSLLDIDSFDGEELDYRDDLLLNNFFSARLNYDFTDKIGMSAVLSDTHYDGILSFADYGRDSHWQNTAFAEVSAKFDIAQFFAFNLWTNYAASFNSRSDFWIHDLRAGTTLKFAPCERVRIELPFAAYYDDGDFNWTPKLRVSYLQNSFFASIGAGKFFVPLNFYETCWNGRIQGENGYSAEISAGFSGDTSFSASFYANYYKDKVQENWGANPFGTLMERRLSGVVERDDVSGMFFGQEFALGFSLGAQCKISEGFSARVLYDLSWNSICDDKKALDDNSFVDYIPIHNFAFGFNAQLRDLCVDFFGHFVSARTESSFFHDEDGDIHIESLLRQAYFTADIALRYRLRDFEIYAKAQNIFSPNYWKHTGQPGKPALFSLGFNYSFR